MPSTFRIGRAGAGGWRTDAPAWRVIAVVVAYLVVFWGVLPAFLFAAGMRLDALVPVRLPLESSHKFLGAVLVLTGSVVTAGAMAQLRLQGRGYPISHLPPVEFVARGLYRWRRHPIYIGFTALFVGVSFLIGSPWCILFSGPLLVLLWTWYARYFEEPVLVERFGEQYIRYRQTTPMLLPLAIGRLGRAIARPVVERTTPFVDLLANRTVAIRFGNYILVTYGLFVAAGCLLALLALGGILRGAGGEEGAIGVLLFGIPVSGMLLARVFWGLGHRMEPPPGGLSRVRRVGFVSWGGLLGMLLFLRLAAHRAGLDPLVAADGFMRALYIGYFLGRLGCLTFGCCYGLPTAGPGVLYHNPLAKAVREQGGTGGRRHATQLYSALLGALLVLLLNTFAMLRPAPGTVAAVGLIAYGAGRFFVEPYRDRRRIARGFLTEGHLGCLASIAAGWTLLVVIPAEPGSGGPAISLPEAFAGGLSLFPYALAAAAVVLVVMGSHWKRIGTW